MTHINQLTAIRWARLLVFVSPFLLASVGCGSKGVVPASAIVTLDGKPLPEASVTFMRNNKEEGRAAFGMTDESGVAQLTTYEPFDGALPGNYTVVILKPPENAHTYEDVVVDKNNIESMIERSSGAGLVNQKRRERVRTTIPKVYSKFNTTPLSCEVTSGTEEYTFDLQSDAGE